MVSKSVTILSFLLPIAMVIGTGIAIEFYKYSSFILLIFIALGGLMVCVYVLVLRSESHRSAR